MKKYINASPEAGKIFYQNFHQNGKIVMLNLLKFKIKADYSDLPHIKPEKELSGAEAYQIYMDLTMPFLDEAGSKLLFTGSSKHFLIGPQEENWDAVLLVEHESVQKFMSFAQNEDYLAIAGHRTAALEDSRLLPMNALNNK
ncbi:MAG: DUF1330 domain-containing protein [Bacteroidota bacterium]